MKKTLLFTLLLCSFFIVKAQTEDGVKAITDEEFEALAPTPPMGWNSWNKFGCNVSEILLKEMADAMCHSGMKEAGYEVLEIK